MLLTRIPELTKAVRYRTVYSRSLYARTRGRLAIPRDALLRIKKPEGKGYAQLGPAIRIGAGSGVGIAVRKDDEALRTKINAALAALKGNGEYKKLADKYFDFDVSGS